MHIHILFIYNIQEYAHIYTASLHGHDCNNMDINVFKHLNL